MSSKYDYELNAFLVMAYLFKFVLISAEDRTKFSSFILWFQHFVIICWMTHTESTPKVSFAKEEVFSRKIVSLTLCHL